MNSFKLLFASIIFFSVSITHADTQKNELTRINGQIQTLQKTLQQDKQQQNDLQQQLKNAEWTISDLSRQVSNFNTALTKEQSQLSELKNTQEATLKKLATQRNALAEQFRATYRLGQTQALKIFLNHQDPALLARHLTYYRYLSEARLNLITQIRASLNKVNENVFAMNQHQQNLKSLVAQKKQQQDQQIKTQESRQKLIDSLNQHVQSKQEQIDTLLANQRTLQQLVSQLQPSFLKTDTTQSFNSRKFDWPVKGILLQRFGSSLGTGDQRLNGVILKAPEGTPVHAISPGKVIFANWLRGFGFLIIIHHDHNYMTLYARNHTLYANVGDYVKAGDTIATTGSSGGYDKSGLYFEIRHNGVPVNPAKWCS